MKYKVNFSIPKQTVDGRKVYFNNLPDFKPEITETFKENGHHYQEIKYNGGTLCLDGYFQSSRYFSHCMETIWATFGTWRPNKGVVSLHVRRGDYLKYPNHHPVLPLEYYHRAINYFQNLGYNDFLCFSDDIKWCYQNLIHFESNIMFSPNSDPLDDLYDGSCCEHHIIANSSFSTWQAYLNRNEDKIVVCPKEENWFGKELKHLDLKDMLPEWIRV